MIDQPEIGMRVMHRFVDGVGTITEVTESKITVKFRAGRIIVFPKTEVSLSVVEKSNQQRTHSRGQGNRGEVVLAALKDGLWHALKELSEITGYESLTGLSACVRAFRKQENGGHTIDKRKREDSNEYEYRLVA